MKNVLENKNIEFSNLNINSSNYKYQNNEVSESIDREKLIIRFPDDLLYKLLKQRLNENECRNIGYVLDGYPRTFKDAQYVFLTK